MQGTNANRECELIKKKDQEITQIEFGRATTYIPSHPSSLIGTESHKPMNTTYATGTITNDQVFPDNNGDDLPLTQLFKQCTSKQSFM